MGQAVAEVVVGQAVVAEEMMEAGVLAEVVPKVEVDKESVATFFFAVSVLLFFFWPCCCCCPLWLARIMVLLVTLKDEK